MAHGKMAETVLQTADTNFAPHNMQHAEGYMKGRNLVNDDIRGLGTGDVERT